MLLLVLLSCALFFLPCVFVCCKTGNGHSNSVIVYTLFGKILSFNQKKLLQKKKTHSHMKNGYIILYNGYIVVTRWLDKNPENKM